MPGFGGAFANFPVKDYPFVVFFKEETEGVRIVRVLHDRMLPTKHV